MHLQSFERPDLPRFLQWHPIFHAVDFESVSSANSNTPARDVAIINALEQKVNPAPLQRYASFVIIAPC